MKSYIANGLDPPREYLYKVLALFSAVATLLTNRRKVGARSSIRVYSLGVAPLGTITAEGLGTGS
jgi:hypothetical protein